MLCPSVMMPKGLSMLDCITGLFDKLGFDDLNVYFDVIIPHANAPFWVIEDYKEENSSQEFN